MKVLVGCPTSHHKSYCLNLFAEGVRNLTYPDKKVLLIDNSKEESYVERIRSYGMPALRSSWFPSARDRIIHGRNLLRELALEEGFDYFFSLEQDVVPPKDVIGCLLAHKKKIVTGVYFNNQVHGGRQIVAPLLYKSSESSPGKLRLMRLSEIRQGGLQEIRGCGLGCVLIHRDVLEKIKFRYKGGFDDLMFCYDSRKAGYKIYADCSIQCRHFCKSWKGIQK